MSNRPSTHRSRSVQHTATARAEDRARSRRRRITAIGAGSAVIVALAVGIAVAQSRPSGPTLDALAGRGQQVARDKGCMSCHTATGDRSEGPTWKGIYDHPVALKDGSTVVVDDAYLTRAIRDPRSQIVAGYGLMPTVPLSDDEVTAVVAYIKALA